jgi:2-dehydropantoate 2-reductase
VVVLAVKAHQIADLAPQLQDLYDDRTVVVPLQNGLPWWFFQKFAGPYEGRRVTPSIRRRHRAPHPAPTASSRASPTRRPSATSPACIRLVDGDRFPLGELDGARTKRVAAIAQAFSAAGFTAGCSRTCGRISG